MRIGDPLAEGTLMGPLVNAQAVDQMQSALGQAVAGMSHHTKNILAGMTSSVDLIDQGLQLGNQEFLNQSWPVFKRCTERISNFVEDMLAYSKPRVPMRRPCDVKAIIQDASETFQGLLVVKKVQLDVDTSRLKHRANVDERAIYRCILNLLTNAADAVPREGGRICISAGTCPGGALCLEVSDNGPGITPEVLERIREPLFTTKSFGTGLGVPAIEQPFTISSVTSSVGKRPSR